mmetsp:Transcript_27811/g.52705  ORF Transcript_27811/g.52705 Transcript_27811/m.52705 type:complete len:252 (-) Transcript_27811:821-1576(-)
MPQARNGKHLQLHLALPAQLHQGVDSSLLRKAHLVVGVGTDVPQRGGAALPRLDVRDLQKEEERPQAVAVHDAPVAPQVGAELPEAQRGVILALGIATLRQVDQTGQAILNDLGLVVEAGQQIRYAATGLPVDVNTVVLHQRNHHPASAAPADELVRVNVLSQVGETSDTLPGGLNVSTLRQEHQRNDAVLRNLHPVVLAQAQAAKARRDLPLDLQFGAVAGAGQGLQNAGPHQPSPVVGEIGEPPQRAQR